MVVIYSIELGDIEEEDNINIAGVYWVWHQGGLLYQGGVQERRPLTLMMIWPKSSWYRVFAFPKGFLISKGNNIFKIPGNPRPTCLPSCGMPLGLGQAFLSPLILRLFWQQPIESPACKTARNTYIHNSIRWITFHCNIIFYKRPFNSQLL